MKRVLGLLVVISICIAFAVPVSAADCPEEAQVSASKMDDIAREDLMNIPIFLVMSENLELTEEQKCDVAAAVSNYCDESVMSLSDDAGYSIMPLSETQRQDVLSSPVYSMAFLRIQDIIDSGATVKYINIYSPNSLVTGSGRTTYENNADSITYWESNYPKLGTYNGYNFLYSEVSAGVESSEVTPGNISSSLNWTEICKKSFSVLFKCIMDTYDKNYYEILSGTSNAVSSMFSLVNKPLSVSYSPSRDYFKVRVSGDLYIRTVYIRDDLNRINGYAYYSWGTTQRLVAVVRASAKCPYLQNPSGTYEYSYPSYSYPRETYKSPGYDGNVTLYKSIIGLYNNRVGYSTHNERIDVYSIVAELLSRDYT